MSHVRFHTAILLLALAALLAPRAAGGADKPEYLIKFATIAPDGSTWMKVMRSLDEEVRRATGGEVGFKLYPGGVQGDEFDVLRKMRFGQLHAAGFTGNGLGEILPDVRILELPFLFESKDEIDYITDRFYDFFDAAFREKGFVLLGWTEVGYVYLFSKTPIRDDREIKGVKVWAWQGDPLARTLFEELGVTPVPLSLPEVLTGLQTGMIDAVYSSPLGALSLQWFTRVKYMNPQPLTNSTGAVLMTLNRFSRLPVEDREKLKEISRRYLRELTLLSRADNAAAIEQLMKSGIRMSEPPDSEALARFRAAGERVKQRLAGSLFDPDLLAQVEKALADYRASRPEEQGDAEGNGR
ncbi:MAG TPA: ABC transporter substrate-binding protein [Bacteroidetes bacterium]|nr:ABC transporter substrate-binding protein [Bacteroidota bacterium]